MSAIVDEANDDLGRVDASDIETARNIGLDDDMFPPVQELQEESSRMPDLGPRVEEGLSDQDSILEAVNQIDEGEEERKSIDIHDQIRKLKQSLQEYEDENSELRAKIDQLESELAEYANQKELDDEDNGESLIPHIKVTLNQFLRNVPLIDRQNEDLLTVIFNMMKYTDREI